LLILDKDNEDYSDNNLIFNVSFLKLWLMVNTLLKTQLAG